MSIPGTCFDSAVKICECKSPPPKFNLSLPPIGLPGNTLPSSSKNYDVWYYILYGVILGLALPAIIIFGIIVWERCSKYIKYSKARTSEPSTDKENGETTTCALQAAE